MKCQFLPLRDNCIYALKTVVVMVDQYLANVVNLMLRFNGHSLWQMLRDEEDYWSGAADGNSEIIHV